MADSYYSVLTAAINDMIEHGFDDPERVARWQQALKESAEASLLSIDQLDAMMRDVLRSHYDRLVVKNGVLKRHEGIDRITYERIRPLLRNELDSRLMAGISLIKLNRQESMARQQRRFAGWATSIPKGGAAEADRAKLKEDIRKPLASLPFEERRVMVDQGHKLVDAINDVLARDGGAIAAKWRAVHQAGYDHRAEHLARDGAILLIRGSWAQQAGLVKPGDAGYTDEIERPGELVYCRCSYIYYYQLRQLPAEMLTKRGQDQLETARNLIST